MTDIEARAWEYAKQPSEVSSITGLQVQGYLAGARAEIALERKRIIEALEHKMRTGGTLAFMAAYPEVKKIIERGV